MDRPVNPDQPRFTLPEFLLIAPHGLSERTLQSWIKRGHLELKQAKVGRGKVRLYTFCEVLQASALFFLTLDGRPPHLAKAIATKLAERARAKYSAGKNYQADSLAEEEAFLLLVYNQHYDERTDNASIRFRAIKAKDFHYPQVMQAFGAYDFGCFMMDEFIARVALAVDENCPAKSMATN